MVKDVKKLEKKFNTVFHKYYWFTCIIKELKLDTLLEKSEDDKKYKKHKVKYYSYVILHNDHLEIVKESDGLFFRGHAGTLKICFKDIVSIDKDKAGLFPHLLIKTDESLFGRTLELSIVKKEDMEVLLDMYSDYKKNNSREEVIEDKKEEFSINSDNLLKYAELYERGLLTLEEFESLKKKII